MRSGSSLASVLTASMIAVGVGGCGDSSDDPTSSATAPVESTTTATTPAQGSPPDAADFLGATLTSATAGEPGVVVQSVEPDSRSRLKMGDVIVAFNGTAVASPDELTRAIGTPRVGARFTIRVVRGSHRFTLTEVQSPTAYLGANVKDASGSAKGAEVVAVAPDSPAADVGLRRGDVITAVDDAPVRTVADLLQAIGTNGPGDSVTISVSRGSRQLEVTPTLAARPALGTGR
jgi:S1-C subfamily serine protease